MGKLQSFFMKQMLKSKLRGMPPAQQKMILDMMEKNPDFFKQLGEEIEAKKKQGKGEMEAAMEVMRTHQSEFQKLMQ